MSEVCALTWCIVLHNVFTVCNLHVVQVLFPVFTSVNLVMRLLVILLSFMAVFILTSVSVSVVIAFDLILKTNTVFSWHVLVLILTLMVLMARLVMLSCIPLLLVDLSLVVVVLIVVRERWSNFTWMSMIVGTLGHDIMLLRSSHSEMKRAMLLILIVIGVIFMAMDILRSHVVMAWVLVVV